MVFSSDSVNPLWFLNSFSLEHPSQTTGTEEVAGKTRHGEERRGEETGGSVGVLCTFETARADWPALVKKGEGWRVSIRQ